MREQIKLVGMSAILTVLVWAAADQFLNESAAIQVVLHPVTPAGAALTITPVVEETDTFRLTVSGPRKLLDRLRDMDPLTVNLTIAAGSTGAGQVRVLDSLDVRSGPLKGLAVTSATPEFYRFIVDREATITVPIVVERGGLDYDVEPTAEPDRATAVLSELALATIPEERRNLVLRADVHLRSRPSGLLLDFEVPLEARIDGVEARISPSQVRLRATLREQRTTATIAAVPIRFEGSADLLNEFRIELRDPGAILTQSITVKGPPVAISRLASGDLKITGVITLTRADALETSQFRFKKPAFHLPPSVELDESDEVAGVEFRLVRNRAQSP